MAHAKPTHDSSFPVQRSLLSAPALAERVLVNYNLPAAPNCHFWSRSINDSYLVEAGGDKYMLRVSPAGWRTYEQVAAEVDLLNFLRQHRLPALRPIPQKAGAYIQTLPAPEGPRQAILFSFAPGAPASPPTERQSQLYGQALAQFHMVTEGYPTGRALLRFDPGDLVDEPLARLQPYLAGRPGTFEELQAIANRLKQTVETLPATTPYYGLCHGDVNNNNFRIDQEENWTLIDFEYAGYGPRVLDIANFSLLQVLPLDKSDQAQQTRAAFLEGYQAVRPLSELELQLLPAFVILRQIWLCGVGARLVPNIGLDPFEGWLFDSCLPFIRAWAGEPW
jgi:Ser/Thr protein kinase RdoA (MazF antagonist)